MLFHVFTEREGDTDIEYLNNQHRTALIVYILSKQDTAFVNTAVTAGY